MSLRDVEDLPAERGIDVTYGTVRCWANKFGPVIAANIRKRCATVSDVWNLDELVQKHRNKAAALKLLRKLLKKQGFAPAMIGAYGLRFDKAAMRELCFTD